MKTRISKRITCAITALLLMTNPLSTFASDSADNAPVDYTFSVTASSNEAGNDPINSIDSSLATKWAAEGKGQWIQYVLKEETEISQIGISFTNANTRTYYFDVQTSLDLENWTTVFSGETTERTEEIQYFELTPSKAKYLRILCNGNSYNLWNNINEVSGIRLAQTDMMLYIDDATRVYHPLPSAQNGNFYVSLEQTLKACGAAVNQQNDNTLEAVTDSKVWQFTANSSVCIKNGIRSNLHAAPIISDGKMMITVNDAVDFLGYRLVMSENGKSAYVYTTKYDKSRETFKKIDMMFENAFDWLIEMYDPETGGFYGTISARDSEGYIVGLEQTSWALNILSKYGNNLLESIPTEIRQKLITFFQSRQDPETGLFINTSGPVDDRNTSRNLSASINALNALGASPLYPLPGERALANAVDEDTVILDAVQPGSKNAVVTTDPEVVEDVISTLPSYLTSLEAYREYLESRDWAYNAWTAGDNLQQTVIMLQQLPEDVRKNYTDILFEFSESTQDPNTGYWGGNGSTNFNTLSGALKMYLAYNSLGRELPNPGKIVESVIETLSSGEVATAACYVRNPVTILQGLKSYDSSLALRIEEAFPLLADGTVNSMRALMCPDGGFSSQIGISQHTFSGIPNGRQLWEGDIDALQQMFLTRMYVYQLLDSYPPELNEYHKDFWKRIQEKKPVEKVKTKYCEPGETAYSEDFENMEEFDETASGLNFLGEGCTAEVVTEGKNKYLKIEDTSTSTAASLICNFPRVSGTVVIEAKMKFGHNGDYVKNINDFSYSGMDIFSKGTELISVNAVEGSASSTLKTVTSTVPSNTYADIDYIGRDRWHKVRIEFTMPTKSSSNIPAVRYYVNDIFSLGAMDLWTQDYSEDYIDKISFFTSQKRTCYICIDDIRIRRKA